MGVSDLARRMGRPGLPVALAEVVTQALAEFGVPGPPESVGMHLAVPTLLEHGSDDLKGRFLRPTATGEIVWCQLFSEPGAGSDLAGLTTRAENDGDEWVVSGQKVWNTGAAQADSGCFWPAPTGTSQSTKESPTSCCPCVQACCRCTPAPADERSLLV